MLYICNVRSNIYTVYIQRWYYTGFFKDSSRGCTASAFQLSTLTCAIFDDVIQ